MVALLMGIKADKIIKERRIGDGPLGGMSMQRQSDLHEGGGRIA